MRKTQKALVSLSQQPWILEAGHDVGFFFFLCIFSYIWSHIKRQMQETRFAFQLYSVIFEESTVYSFVISGVN